MLPSVEMGKKNSQQILNIYLIVFPVALTGCLPTKGSPPKFWSLMITCYPTVLRAEQFADFSYLPFLSLSLGTRVQSFFKKLPYSFSHILEHYLSQGGDGGGMCVCVCMWAYDRRRNIDSGFQHCSQQVIFCSGSDSVSCPLTSGISVFQ